MPYWLRLPRWKPARPPLGNAMPLLNSAQTAHVLHLTAVKSEAGLVKREVTGAASSAGAAAVGGIRTPPLGPGRTAVLPNDKKVRPIRRLLPATAHTAAASSAPRSPPPGQIMPRPPRPLVRERLLPPPPIGSAEDVAAFEQAAATVERTDEQRGSEEAKDKSPSVPAQKSKKSKKSKKGKKGKKSRRRRSCSTSSDHRRRRSDSTSSDHRRRSDSTSKKSKKSKKGKKGKKSRSLRKLASTSSDHRRDDSDHSRRRRRRKSASRNKTGSVAASSSKMTAVKSQVPTVFSVPAKPATVVSKPKPKQLLQAMQGKAAVAAATAPCRPRGNPTQPRMPPPEHLLAPRVRFPMPPPPPVRLPFPMPPPPPSPPSAWWSGW